PSPVARAQRTGLIGDSVPRMTGAARGIVLFLLVAVVIGGAIWGYLGQRDTEPSAELGQMMEQATESASEATDATSDAVQSVAEGASEAASTAAETTAETIEGVGDEIQTQTDAAFGEGTDSASQASEQAAESVPESLSGLEEPAPGTSATEGTGEAMTGSISEPLSTGEPPTIAPETTSPAPPESTVSEPVATPAPEQVAPPASETSGSEASTETFAVTEPATEAAVPESTSTSAGSETITVQPGEYLYSIAKRIYGDASKWRLIYEANRDQLSDPDAVRVGMKLLVPATN
ncbi:MAG: LysM peptidoglycan-binding domain-containing protein, partial [Gammaproteobacteria bacterium]